MTYGVTATGFVRKTYTEISDALKVKLLATVSPLLRFAARDKFGNLVAIFADEISQAWEAIEAAYHGYDPDSCTTEEQFESLCRLTRVTRRGATQGTVLCTINVDSSFAAAAGTLTACPADYPGNLWSNRDAVASPGGGNVTGVVFQSQTIGATPFVAAGALDTISQPISGWNSVVSTADATSGQDIESIDELRVRRDASLAAEGGSTLAGIVSENILVAKVLAVDGRENTSDAFADIPGHTFEICVYENALDPADDDLVAQAIWDSKPAGIRSVGFSSGAATDSWGTAQTVYFTDGTPILIYIRATVTGTYDSDDAKAALVAVYATPTFRQTIVLERLRAELFGVSGVTDVPSFELSVDGSNWISTNIVPAFRQLCLLDTSRITLT
jgi:uncharacterized phage protein gp47/JayE